MIGSGVRAQGDPSQQGRQSDWSYHFLEISSLGNASVIEIMRTVITSFCAACSSPWFVEESLPLGSPLTWSGHFEPYSRLGYAAREIGLMAQNNKQP